MKKPVGYSDLKFRNTRVGFCRSMLQFRCRPCDLSSARRGFMVVDNTWVNHFQFRNQTTVKRNTGRFLVQQR